MKKLIIAFTAVLSICFWNISAIAEEEPTVKIEIPASEIHSIDVKYEKEQQPSKTSKALESTKAFTDKSVKATKKGYHKAIKATKKGYNKTVETTKDLTDKSVKATKKGYKKTVETTKDLTGEAKGVIDNLNPDKTVTLGGLEASAAIKNLKDEKQQIKKAYDSRIKDVNAQIKAAEVSTTITEVQRQNKIYTLSKEKESLTEQRNQAIKERDNRIKELRKSL